MRSLGKVSLQGLAALISEKLREHGIEAVLSGGAVVSIYSRNKYLSYDLDFVSSASSIKLEAAMAELGFHRGKGRHFTHLQTDFYVEFPPGPLAIGRRPVTRWTRKRTAEGILDMLDPTQCVMDRLAAWYHWHDPQSLEQAVLVAKKHRVRWPEVREWSLLEGMADRFEIFRSRLGLK